MRSPETLSERLGLSSAKLLAVKSAIAKRKAAEAKRKALLEKKLLESSGNGEGAQAEADEDKAKNERAVREKIEALESALEQMRVKKHVLFGQLKKVLMTEAKKKREEEERALERKMLEQQQYNSMESQREREDAGRARGGVLGDAPSSRRQADEREVERSRPEPPHSPYQPMYGRSFGPMGGKANSISGDMQRAGQGRFEYMRTGPQRMNTMNNAWGGARPEPDARGPSRSSGEFAFKPPHEQQQYTPFGQQHPSIHPSIHASNHPSNHAPAISPVVSTPQHRGAKPHMPSPTSKWDQRPSPVVPPFDPAARGPVGIKPELQNPRFPYHHHGPPQQHLGAGPAGEGEDVGRLSQSMDARRNSIGTPQRGRGGPAFASPSLLPSPSPTPPLRHTHPSPAPFGSHPPTHQPSPTMPFRGHMHPGRGAPSRGFMRGRGGRGAGPPIMNRRGGRGGNPRWQGRGGW